MNEGVENNGAALPTDNDASVKPRGNIEFQNPKTGEIMFFDSPEDLATFKAELNDRDNQ